MAVLKVEDMHCAKCVERIEKALRDAAVDCTISLDDKTVTVEDKAETIKKAVSELDDIGYEAVPVQ